MATISGRVNKLVDSETAWVHAVDAPVLILLEGKPIAEGVVDRDDQFSIEIPDDAHGELEIRVALNGAAPAFVTADGNDIDTLVIYNPGNAAF